MRLRLSPSIQSSLCSTRNPISFEERSLGLLSRGNLVSQVICSDLVRSWLAFQFFKIRSSVRDADGWGSAFGMEDFAAAGGSITAPDDSLKLSDNNKVATT